MPANEHQRQRTREGARLPYRESARIASEKLTEYALHPDKSKGKHKGFAALGYHLDDWQILHKTILEGLEFAEATHVDVSQPGRVSFTVELRVRGPNGRTGVIRTGWCVDAERAPWLTTLIPIPD